MRLAETVLFEGSLIAIVAEQKYVKAVEEYTTYAATTQITTNNANHIHLLSK